MMISRKSPTSQEQYIFMGNGTRVQVVFFRVVRLHFSTLFFFGIAICDVHTLN